MPALEPFSFIRKIMLSRFELSDSQEEKVDAFWGVLPRSVPPITLYPGQLQRLQVRGRRRRPVGPECTHNAFPICSLPTRLEGVRAPGCLCWS